MTPTVFDFKRWCDYCRHWVNAMAKDNTCFNCGCDTVGVDEYQSWTAKDAYDDKVDREYLHYKENVKPYEQ